MFWIMCLVVNPLASWLFLRHVWIIAKAKIVPLARAEQSLTQLPSVTGGRQKSIKRPLNGHSSAEGTCGDGGGNVTAVTVVVSACQQAGLCTVTWNVQPLSKLLVCGLCEILFMTCDSVSQGVWYGFLYLLREKGIETLFFHATSRAFE